VQSCKTPKSDHKCTKNETYVFVHVAHAETIVNYNLGTLHGTFLGIDERTGSLLDVHTL
jgi:hypothetical protein